MEDETQAEKPKVVVSEVFGAVSAKLDEKPDLVKDIAHYGPVGGGSLYGLQTLTAVGRTLGLIKPSSPAPPKR